MADRKLSETLRERGYAYQFSSETLEEIADSPKTLYWGVDPSADSMHIGQLMGMLVVRRFIEAGHRVIFLAGGATGMIGDPGGKNEERPLLDLETIRKNVAGIEAQAKRLLDVENIEFVNNAEWLGTIGLLEFLRDTGKYETVNAMIKRETVAKRIEDPEQSISYAEFTYMLLQAHDFWHLFTQRDVTLQVGASDQWGNIISGVDLIRHKEGKTAYAFTWPLLINKATGKKFGKSEGGALWLDAAKTSPYELYQYLLNSEDDAVEEYLLKLTLLPLDAIRDVMAKHAEAPEERIAQQRLAEEVTTLVHGEGALATAKRISEALFAEELSDDEWQALTEAPKAAVALGTALVDALVGIGLASSKREAREFIQNGAITLTGRRIADTTHILAASDFSPAGLAILKRGKRQARVIEAA
ncbi:MAG TPA: tyrosine--tRNA ligase [Candidatus Paceibacterota bacterium]|nr:tyrosine--tRNA ligase [Candidatus Paceibacterota bacterium]